MPRIAFLSTAHVHTRGFIENFLKASDGRVVAAVWDDVPARGRRYAELAKSVFVAGLDAVLADPSIDGFIITSENTRHLPLLRKALPVGKPVFCEKPLVTSGVELEEVKALLARYRTPLVCGYFHPFDPALLAATALVKAGAFGRITRVRYRNAHHAAYGHWFDNPDLAWFYDPALSGGGAFMDMGTHAIHALRTIFGPVSEVFAVIGNHSGIYPTCDDNGIALLKFANDILGTVEAAWTQTGGIGGLEITGSAGSLWNTAGGYVTGAIGRAPEALAPAAAGEPTRVDRLVAVIRGEVPEASLQADLSACIDAVTIMESAYAAAKAGRWIRITP
jgi:predicted dehydrogenase